MFVSGVCPLPVDVSVCLHTLLSVFIFLSSVGLYVCVSVFLCVSSSGFGGLFFKLWCYDCGLHKKLRVPAARSDNFRQKL